MATAWEILQNSTDAPAGSTAWVVVNNLVGSTSVIALLPNEVLMTSIAESDDGHIVTHYNYDFVVEDTLGVQEITHEKESSTELLIATDQQTVTVDNSAYALTESETSTILETSDIPSTVIEEQI